MELSEVISVEYNICGISSWRPRISVEYLWDNGGPEKEEGDLWNYLGLYLWNIRSVEYPPGAQEYLWNICWIEGSWGNISGIICLQDSFLGPRKAPGRPQEGFTTPAGGGERVSRYKKQGNTVSEDGKSSSKIEPR